MPRCCADAPSPARKLISGPIRTRKQVARGRPGRILSWRRLLLSLAVGVVAGSGVDLLGAPALSVLAGWIVAAGGLLGWVWWISWPQDHRGTKRLAEEEGRTHATDTVVLVAAVASLIAVVVALVRSGSRSPQSIAAVVLDLLVVIVSWALVNTVFALKYAREYYTDGDGGIDFNQDEPPSYSDFAFVAFCVGMTFAVAETPPTTTRIRRMALGHGLLSFVFGTIVLAASINLLANSS